MIYIIDERKERQKEYAPFLLEQADETIKCIYSKEELDDIKQQMFSNAQFICFHDSFFKNPENISLSKIVVHIENAVPVDLGYIIGKSILKHLKENHEYG